MTPYFDEDGITIYHGDCREVLPSLTVDAVVTDPPYGNGSVYGDYEDSPESLRELVATVHPMFLDTARVVAVTPGIGNIHKWPDPTWVLCWFTKNGKGSSSWGFNNWQPILVYGPDPYLAAGMGRRPDAASFHLGPFNTTVNGHPSPKPTPIMRWIVDRVVLPGSNSCVVDPFMGSGSTLVAAKEAGHQAIGIEIEERYCEIAVQRLAQGVLDFA